MKTPKTPKKDTPREMDLKSMLETVLPAAKDEECPQLNQRMVQVFNNRLWCYGGDICISVPCAMDIAVAFLPKPAVNFFKIDRPNVTFVAKGKELLLKSGIAKRVIPTMERTNVPVLTVLGTTVPSDLHRANVKFASNLVEPDSERPFARGVCFRDGGLLCGRGADVFYGASGIPEEVPEFIISKLAAKTLASQKSKLESVTFNDRENYAIEFKFADGTWIACRMLELEIPDMASIFGKPVNCSLTFPPEVIAEIKSAGAFKWHISRDNLTFTTEGKDARVVNDSGEVAHASPDLEGYPEGILIADKFLQVGLELSGGSFDCIENGLIFYGPNKESAYATATMYIYKQAEPRPAVRPKTLEEIDAYYASGIGDGDEDEIPF